MHKISFRFTLYHSFSSNIRSTNYQAISLILNNYEKIKKVALDLGLNFKMDYNNHWRLTGNYKILSWKFLQS